jgi:hypothetical protein
VVLNGTIDGNSVVSAVRPHRGESTIYRCQQVSDWCRIARAVRRDLRREDLGGCRVNDEMSLAPGSAIARVGRSGRAAVSFQACAVNEDVHGAISGARIPHVRLQG